MRRTARCLILILIAVPAAHGQRPVFSPPERPAPAPDKPGPAKKPGDRPKPSTGEKPAIPAPSAVPAQDDAIGLLLHRLSQWPQPRAKDAALVLAGLGAQAKDRLLLSLSDNDWRVQAGSAFALAEMGERDAVPSLKLAISDPSNRAGLGDLMVALVRLDPDQGTSAILPFIAHQSARVRQSARDALPRTLPAKFLQDVVSLWRNPRGPVRASALELLRRIEGGAEREEWFLSLTDPEAQVAIVAARFLAQTSGTVVLDRLQDAAANAPMRAACYSLLALVMEEDLHGVGRVSEESPIKKRVQLLLGGEDPFYRGTAAIVLSNLSYRSEDAALRKLADQYLVPILIGTVAGGVYFSDYSAVEDLCWRKLELLSGQKFGQDAPAWKDWWHRSESGFVARREIRRLLPDDVARCRILFTRAGPDGRLTQIALSGAEKDFGAAGSDAPFVLGPTGREELAAVLEGCGFFETRGEAEDPARLDGFVRWSVSIPASGLQYQRLHYGPTPDGLRRIAEFFEKTRKALAWQRFLTGANAEERQKAAKLEEAFFAGDATAEAKDARVLDLALAAWPRASVAVKRLAVTVFSESTEAWRAAHKGALAELLKSEKTLTEEAGEIVGLLGGASEKELRDTVIELALASETRKSGDVLRAFLAQQAEPSVIALMADARPKVRAAAAENLVRFKDRIEVVNLLIVGLNDYEAPVREACLKSLASMSDERILAMIETLLKGDDPALRLRAIQALGAVGREQAVPRLMEIWRDGDRRIRWTVIHALKEAGGRRALAALTSIVRETGEIDTRKEALDNLVNLGGTDAATQVQEILEKTPESEIKIQAIGGLAKLLGLRALPVLGPFTEHEDKAVARIATLTLARVGAKDALPKLVKFLEASVEGDIAAERALEDLTFRSPLNPSPPRRLDDHRLFAERHAGEERHTWLLLAARDCGVPLDDAIDWIQASALEPLNLRVLVALLEKGNRPLRRFADERLRTLTGKNLPELSPLALPTEVEERTAQWRVLLAERKSG